MKAAVMVVVEGETDVPFVKHLADAAGLAIAHIIVTRGKDKLDQALDGYNAGAKGMGWFVLRDLDADATCASGLVSCLLSKPERFMCFRVAVRSIEAWAMADPERLSKFLRISKLAIPSNPDEVSQAKLELVNLARKSKKPTVRSGMVPPEGASVQVGPSFQSMLIEYTTNHWRWQEAQENSGSLKRCIRALNTLRADLTVQSQG